MNLVSCAAPPVANSVLKETHAHSRSCPPTSVPIKRTFADRVILHQELYLKDAMLEDHMNTPRLCRECYGFQASSGCVNYQLATKYSPRSIKRQRQAAVHHVLSFLSSFLSVAIQPPSVDVLAAPQQCRQPSRPARHGHSVKRSMIEPQIARPAPLMTLECRQPHLDPKAVPSKFCLRT